MPRAKTGRRPIITIRLHAEERAEFEASVPEGRTMTEVGRERLAQHPNPEELDGELAQRALDVLDQEHYADANAETRAHWMREELFPNYEPLEVMTSPFAGAKKTGKRGRKASTVMPRGDGKSMEVTRDAKVKVVVDHEVYEDICLIAEALGITLSTYCRRVLMGQPVFALELHMSPVAVRRHAERTLAVKRNGLDYEMQEAAERLVAKEAERIARAAAREVRKAKQPTPE